MNPLPSWKNCWRPYKSNKKRPPGRFLCVHAFKFQFFERFRFSLSFRAEQRGVEKFVIPVARERISPRAVALPRLGRNDKCCLKQRDKSEFEDVAVLKTQKIMQDVVDCENNYANILCFDRFCAKCVVLCSCDANFADTTAAHSVGVPKIR